MACMYAKAQVCHKCMICNVAYMGEEIKIPSYDIGCSLKNLAYYIFVVISPRMSQEVSLLANRCTRPGGQVGRCMRMMTRRVAVK